MVQVCCLIEGGKYLEGEERIKGHRERLYIKARKDSIKLVSFQFAVGFDRAVTGKASESQEFFPANSSWTLQQVALTLEYSNVLTQKARSSLCKSNGDQGSKVTEPTAWHQGGAGKKWQVFNYLAIVIMAFNYLCNCDATQNSHK